MLTSAPFILLANSELCSTFVGSTGNLEVVKENLTSFIFSAVLFANGWMYKTSPEAHGPFRVGVPGILVSSRPYTIALLS